MDKRVRFCKLCGAPVIFLATKTKTIIVDADGVDSTDMSYDASKHTPHSESCEEQEAKRWR